MSTNKNITNDTFNAILTKLFVSDERLSHEELDIFLSDIEEVLTNGYKLYTLDEAVIALGLKDIKELKKLIKEKEVLTIKILDVPKLSFYIRISPWEIYFHNKKIEDKKILSDFIDKFFDLAENYVCNADNHYNISEVCERFKMPLDTVTRLTRNMIGTDDDDLYWSSSDIYCLFFDNEGWGTKIIF